MGRPRKPTKLLELSGAFDHDPQRRRPNEPKEGRPLGPAPKRIPDEVLPYWDEVVDMLPGVLTYRDRWAVEIAARLMKKLANGPPDIQVLAGLVEGCELDATQVKSLIDSDKITSSELATLRSLLAALGMTPADRSKLSVATDEQKPKNRFSEFSEEKARAWL